MIWDDCGTSPAYHRHKNAGEKPCDLCREWKNRQERERYARTKNDPRPPCRLDGCERQRARRSSLCPMHLARKKRHGDVNTRMTLSYDMPMAERIRACSLVDESTGCWEWQLSKLKGYGMIPNGGRYSTQYAHRLSYEAFVGPIPDGLVIDHLCRNPGCVNPDHLEPVTAGENTRRGHGPTMIAWREGRCMKGHARTPENTYVSPHGKRACLDCRREKAMAG